MYPLVDKAHLNRRYCWFRFKFFYLYRFIQLSKFNHWDCLYAFETCAKVRLHLSPTIILSYLNLVILEHWLRLINNAFASARRTRFWSQYTSTVNAECFSIPAIYFYKFVRWWIGIVYVNSNLIRYLLYLSFAVVKVSKDYCSCIYHQLIQLRSMIAAVCQSTCNQLSKWRLIKWFCILLGKVFDLLACMLISNVYLSMFSRQFHCPDAVVLSQFLSNGSQVYFSSIAIYNVSY